MRKKEAAVAAVYDRRGRRKEQVVAKTGSRSTVIDRRYIGFVFRIPHSSDFP
jgi:hypothetical protein